MYLKLGPGAKPCQLLAYLPGNCADAQPLHVVVGSEDKAAVHLQIHGPQVVAIPVVGVTIHVDTWYIMYVDCNWQS